MSFKVFDLKLFASVLCVVLSGCSDSGEDYDDYEDAVDEESTYLDEESWSPANDGWREGTLVIEVLIKQAGSFSEGPEEPTTSDKENSTKVSWSYELDVKSSQKVWVPADLSVYMPDGSDEERYEYLTSSPFIEYDNATNINTVGELSYQAHHSVNSPTASDVKKLEKHIVGKGTDFFLDLSHMEPSIFGPGYEFTLKVDYDYSQEGSLASVYQTGQEASIDLAARGSESFKFYVYPQPNKEGLNDYPYLYEESQVMDKQNLKEMENIKMATLTQLQEIADKKVDFVHQMHVGSVTKKLKDLLVVEYVYTDTNVLPFIGNLDSLVAKPTESKVEIRITLKPGD